MPVIKKTSVSLIKDLAADRQSPRWEEMYRTYKEPMRCFIAAKFPALLASADDLVQDTMVVLSERLPDYHYLPDEKGHFRNYLMGILRNLAADEMTKLRREKEARTRLGVNQPGKAAGEQSSWRMAAFEVAVSQVLADGGINPMHREVFRHIVCEKESPEDIATKFGMSRANVDQIKSRMIKRLRKLVDRLTEV